MTVPAVPLPQPDATPPPGERDLWPRPEDYPNVDELVIEDGKPVDGIFSEKQLRLLTEPPHSCWTGPGEGQPFVVMANVGVFHTAKQPPIVPDVLLAVGVQQGNLQVRENRTYIVWLRGKVPDVAIEIVSNREGGEDTDKLRIYARIGVPYYAIFDPDNLLGRGVLRVYKLSARTYEPLAPPYSFAEVGLGVVLWTGRYEDFETTWLRWCDRDGQLIPTGAEQLAEERQARERAQQEIEQLKAKLRQLGVEPPS